MRLEGREKKIIVILQKGPSTSRDMSRELGVSRRTVLRDIKRINNILISSAAGRIIARQSYYLHIDSESILESLMQSSYDAPTEVLISLLTTPSCTLDNISERTLLSKSAVRHAIADINNAYTGILKITSYIGKGYKPVFFKLSAADMLGGLCWQNKDIKDRIEALVKNQTEAFGLMRNRIEDYRKKVSPWVSDVQVHIQIYAAAATANLLFGESANTLLCYKALEKFIAHKIDLLDWLQDNRSSIMNASESLMSRHGAHMLNEHINDLIFDHIARISLFPTRISEEFIAQIDELRCLYPFEFDFATMYCQTLEHMRSDLSLEPELLALYVLGTFSSIQPLTTRILLLCGRKSFEQVNRTLLDETLGYTDIVAVQSVSQAIQKASCEKFDLFIRDELVRDPNIDEIPWNLSYAGIMQKHDLREISRAATYARYRKSLPSLLPENNFVMIDTDSHDVYEQVLVRGLDEFQHRGCMSAHEANIAIEREDQGNLLQFGGVAIPHCVIQDGGDNFRLFAIVPTCPIKGEDCTISLILVVFVSSAQEDKSTIFSYIYSVLVHNQRCFSGFSYDELVDVLTQEGL